MTAPEHALADVVGPLRALGLRFMLIGGLANAVRGVARATVDVDLAVWAEADAAPAIVAAMAPALAPLVADPTAFVRDTRVLPLRTHQGVRVDLVFAMLPFEDEALRRATHETLAGVAVPVATAEDLVLMKIHSTRDRDLADARGIIERHRSALDRGYLEPRIRELAQLLARPEIEARWRVWSGGAGADL